MSAASEKGRALERAVRSIEEAILAASPDARHETIVIESNKIVTVGGVRHEIDIWVELAPATGYTSFFIFECKNRDTKVDKNDIVIFSHKITAVSAQRGFFVASAYTQDALNLAAQDPRITILTASDLSDHDMPVPLGFHFVNTKPIAVAAQFKAFEPRELHDIPLDTIVHTPGGPHSIRDYTAKLAKDVMDQAGISFSSQLNAAGLYERDYEQNYEFAHGDLVIDGRPIRQVQLNVTCEHRVLQPRVVSRYDVATRGRVHVLESVESVDEQHRLVAQLVEHRLGNTDRHGLFLSIKKESDGGV